MDRRIQQLRESRKQLKIAAKEGAQELKTTQQKRSRHVIDIDRERLFGFRPLAPRLQVDSSSEKAFSGGFSPHHRIEGHNYLSNERGMSTNLDVQ